MIEVNVTGTEALRAKLQHIGEVLTQQALDSTALELEQYIEGEAAKHHKTGALVRSVYKAPIPGGWFIGHDLRHAPHARFVIEGTRPHLITPKNKKALRWPVGGKFAFAKEVKHPGYRGDNYLQRAAALAPAVFELHVNQKLKALQ